MKESVSYKVNLTIKERLKESKRKRELIRNTNFVTLNKIEIILV